LQSDESESDAEGGAAHVLRLPRLEREEHTKRGPDPTPAASVDSRGTFRHVVATAKPGWRYLIDAARYRTFDPGQPVEPDVLVSAFSPDSGRFEPDGPCWTGFAGYTASVRR
jgi:hypothetical protein